MQITKKAPNIILAVITVAAFIWCSFSANMMEQFLHMRGTANLIGSIAQWISMTGFVAAPAALLYEESRCRTICIFAVLPASVTAAAFSRAYFSVHTPAPYEIAAYICANAAMLASCLYLLFTDKPGNHGTLPRAALLFALLLAGVLPLNIFMQSRTLLTAAPLRFYNFGLWHFFFIALLVAATIGLYLLMRNKGKPERVTALYLLSMVLLHQLCMRFSFVRLQDYQTAHGIVGALPLYVCSFGVVLLPIAVLSGSAFFQGALFMINCPGAIIAFVWPNTGPVTIFHYNVTYFVFSHILLFVTTAHLAISADGMPRRAHLAHLSYAILAYYLLMVVLNGIAVRFGNGYDPNFSYVAQCPLPLPLHKILPVRLGMFTFSPIYLLILCAVQFCLCLVAYFLCKLFALIFSRLKRGPCANQTV